MQRVQVDRVNTVLYCDEWADTVAFYRDALGLDVEHASDWFVEFRLTDDAYVSVADARRATIRSGNGRGITLTLRSAALVEAQAVLDAHGIETTPIARRWGAEVFYCHDPEGHRIEFWAGGAPAG